MEKKNNYIEVEGVSIEDAIQKGLKELNTTIENIDIEILREPKNGILKIGSQKALVRLTLLKGEIKTNTEEKIEKKSKKIKIDLSDTVNENNEMNENIIKKFNNIVNLMGFEVHPELIEMKNKYRIIIKDTENANLLIGKNGKTIEALQHILNKALIKDNNTKPIYIDIKGYVKQKRKNKLEKKWKPQETQYSHK